jgi:hypothetical protein
VTYFKDEEFACPCSREECDAPQGPHRLLRLYLDRAREMLGAPIIVTSGNRCAAHNADVGGETDSEHVFPEGCLGADVAAVDGIDGRSRYLLVEAVRQAGFTRLGLYRDNHVHVGIGDAVDEHRFPPQVIWVR